MLLSVSSFRRVTRGFAVFATSLAFVVPAAVAQDALLPASTESYLAQADGIRRAHDRPWSPMNGQLGNLRELHLIAPDCTVRIVSGNENRVFSGTREVVVVEGSRIFDTDPDETPAPRDVTLAFDRASACPGPGTCGVSVTAASNAPTLRGAPDVCFTVQLATAHRLLVAGDRLSLVVDRLRQPVLRIAVNPSHALRIWFQQVDMGHLVIDANAAVAVGGTGRVAFLSGSSSARASVMYFHAFDAENVGVSTTTGNTRWSIRIDENTKRAVYGQPARAPGKIRELYPIEIDGPIERLEVPAGSVDPRPLGDGMREEMRALRDDLLARAGPLPPLPTPDDRFPTAAVALQSLPVTPTQRVARVVSRIMPASVQLTKIALWKGGGRVEATAPDATIAKAAMQRLKDANEFIVVQNGISVDRGATHDFSALLTFSCDVPGQVSECMAGDPMSRGTYSKMQVRRLVEPMLGPDAKVNVLTFEGDTIRIEAEVPDDDYALGIMEKMRQPNGLFRTSVFGHGPDKFSPVTNFTAVLKLICREPPKPDGVCAPQPVAKAAPAR